MQMASDILFGLTKNRWPGECADVVRPPDRCVCGWVARPLVYDTSVVGLDDFGYPRCGCGYVSQYRLPGFPVLHVDQVLVNGDVIPPDRYRVDNYAELVYLPDPDGTGTPISGWPLWQRPAFPVTEPGTWQVSYTYGSPPPIGGKVAAALLGCQIALGLAGDDTCRLPSGTIQATRQNLTVAILDPLTVFPQGLTGLREVDLWLSSLRYADENKAASVWVPGRRHGARRRTS